MFLLFLVLVSEHAAPENIYIPICFYYFRLLPEDEWDEFYNLHSNMFLLFPKANDNQIGLY